MRYQPPGARNRTILNKIFLLRGLVPIQRRVVFFTVLLVGWTPALWAAPSETVPGSLDSALVSFLTPELPTEYFQPQLRNLATQTNQLRALPVDSAQANSELEQLSNELRQMRETLSRGYQDELSLLEGLIFERRGLSDEAMKAYERSLEFRSDRSLALFRHAYLLSQLGQCAKATEELREVLWRSASARHEVLFLLAQCTTDPAELPRRENYLEQAHAAAPTNPLIAHELGKSLLDQAGRSKVSAERAALEERAIIALEIAANQRPLQSDVVSEYAQLILQRSDPLVHSARIEHAEALLVEANLQAHYENDNLVRLLFDLYVKSAKLEKAQEVLELGVAASPASEVLLRAQEQLKLEKSLNLS